MSPLRQQMIDAMVLRGLARRTQQAYLSVVAQLAAHYHCSPDRLDGVDQAVVSPAAISITAMAPWRSRPNCSGLDEAA